MAKEKTELKPGNGKKRRKIKYHKRNQNNTVKYNSDEKFVVFFSNFISFYLRRKWNISRCYFIVSTFRVSYSKMKRKRLRIQYPAETGVMILTYPPIL